MGPGYRPRAMLTTSMARSTPAQKPRGLASQILFGFIELSRRSPENATAFDASRFPQPRQNAVPGSAAELPRQRRELLWRARSPPVARLAHVGRSIRVKPSRSLARVLNERNPQFLGHNIFASVNTDHVSRHPVGSIVH